MVLPPLDDPRWQRTLLSSSDLTSVSLATRLLVARLRREVARDPGRLETAVDELRGFFAKNESARLDIASLER